MIPILVAVLLMPILVVVVPHILKAVQGVLMLAVRVTSRGKAAGIQEKREGGLPGLPVKT